MATKRTKRIDPNAAFNAIVGISPPPEEALAETPQGVREATGGAGEATQKTGEEPAAAPGTPGPKPPPEEAAEAKKLVQKGYYLTEEQVRQLGICAVMNGVDRSSIVREALERYFAAEKGPAL